MLMLGDRTHCAGRSALLDNQAHADYDCYGHLFGWPDGQRPVQVAGRAEKRRFVLGRDNTARSVRCALGTPGMPERRRTFVADRAYSAEASLAEMAGARVFKLSKNLEYNAAKAV